MLDALAVLMGTPVTASSCITLASAEAGGPALLAVELSPGGAAVVMPDEDGLLVHANHFVVAPAAGRDTQPAEHPGTLLRAWKAARLARAGADVETVLSTHFPAPEGICRHAVAEGVDWAERRATLLSVVADPGAPELRLAAGPPCEAPYAAVALPWAAARAAVA
jgi:isopenicillin-N N-acyltransferase-like protein